MDSLLLAVRTFVKRALERVRRCACVSWVRMLVFCCGIMAAWELLALAGILVSPARMATCAHCALTAIGLQFAL